jgi:type IV pilus assembly protein PilB
MIGEILIDAGYITDTQLEDALDLQQENRTVKLGQILVALKYVTPNDICVALASQLECAWIDLANVVIPKEIAKILPEKMVRDLWIIPVEKKGENGLVIATSNPQDAEALNKIKEQTSLDVELVIAYDGHLEAAIDYYFPPKAKKRRKTK